MSKDAAKSVVVFSEKKYWGKLDLNSSSFFSMDNTICHLVYIAAKEYMNEVGHEQFKMYKKMIKTTSDKIAITHARVMYRRFKKIRKALKEIDRLVGDQEFDIVVVDALKFHIDTIWKHKSILWN